MLICILIELEISDNIIDIIICYYITQCKIVILYVFIYRIYLRYRKQRLFFFELCIFRCDVEIIGFD